MNLTDFTIRKQNWAQRLCLWRITGTKSLINVCVQPLPPLLPQCSKTCGRGLRKRSVFCSSTDPGARAVVVPDSMCRQHHRPKAQETCVLRRCPKNERLQWIPAPWGEVQRRRDVGASQNSKQKSSFNLFMFETHRNLRVLSLAGEVVPRLSPRGRRKNNMFSHSCDLNHQESTSSRGSCRPFQRQREQRLHFSEEFNSRSGRNLSWKREKETSRSQQPQQTSSSESSSVGLEKLSAPTEFTSLG